jgi:hypothetical protein
VPTADRTGLSRLDSSHSSVRCSMRPADIDAAVTRGLTSYKAARTGGSAYARRRRQDGKGRRCAYPRVLREALIHCFCDWVGHPHRVHGGDDPVEKEPCKLALEPPGAPRHVLSTGHASAAKAMGALTSGRSAYFRQMIELHLQPTPLIARMGNTLVEFEFCFLRRRISAIRISQSRRQEPAALDIMPVSPYDAPRPRRQGKTVAARHVGNVHRDSKLARCD